MAAIRRCETCGCQLHQRADERYRDWVKRRTCGRRCAGKIPKRPKPEDPAVWVEVASWLRSEGAFDVHGPCRSLSRDEIAELEGLYS